MPILKLGVIRNLHVCISKIEIVKNTLLQVCALRICTGVGRVHGVSEWWNHCIREMAVSSGQSGKKN